MKSNTLYVGGVRKRVGVDTRYSAFPCTVVLPDKRLFMVWREGTDHVASRDGIIVGSFSTDQGQTWGAKVTVVNEASTDVRDPAITLSNDGNTIFLTYFKGTTAIPGNGCFMRTSTDHGATWGNEIRIDALPYSAICSPVVQNADGSLVAVFYGRADMNAETHDSIWAIRSTNGGTTWSSAVRMLNGQNDGRDYQEPWVVKDASGQLLVTYRWGTDDGIGLLHSTDGGQTFSGATRCFTGTGRPSAVLTSGSGALVVAYRQPGSVSNGAVRASYDGGLTWTREQVTEPALPDFWTYSGPVEVSPDVIFCPSAVERGFNDSFLTARYLTSGALATPFGDAIPDRSVNAALRAKALVVWDDFDRPDNQYLTDTASGHNWQGTGQVAIKEGCAWDQGGSAMTLNYVNARTPHMEVEAEFQWVVNPGFGLVFRLRDNNNYMLATIETGGNYLRLYKIINSRATCIGTAKITPTPGLWTNIKVVALGNLMRVFLDDVLAITVSDSTLASYPWVGIKTNSASGGSGCIHKVRSLSVRARA